MKTKTKTKKVKKRNVYIKQIDKNLYYACLEYGIKPDKRIPIVKDYVLKKFVNLDDAIFYKNKLNQEIDERVDTKIPKAIKVKDIQDKTIQTKQPLESKKVKKRFSYKRLFAGLIIFSIVILIVYLLLF